ncbi:MAG: antibiotic biosynthesis monooxygenase [Burkholderiales bacterium]|nr:MAG: antibiotic biosynthesis monooxygenase [Burkholderiales bacterium]
MILEIATLTIQSGQQAAFEAGVAQAIPVFLRAKGCRGLQLQRCIEDPLSYRLHVQWDTLENHTVEFRTSPDFQVWRGLVGQYFSSAPQVVHSEQVLSSH